MPDFILLMRGDLSGPEEGWPAYLDRLNASGQFRGGSTIGPGAAHRKGDPPQSLGSEIVGFVRIEAPDLAAAEAFVAGNPVYEAGGTVEVRLLPADDE
jgi:uncharacterized protein YciI